MCIRDRVNATKQKNIFTARTSLEIKEEFLKDVLDKIREFYSDEKLLSDVINNAKEKFMAELPALKRRKNYLTRHTTQLGREKENLLNWMGDTGVKPYTLNAINEKLEKIEPELNKSRYELMRLEELFERRSRLACSSKNVARDISRSLANFSDFSFGEKKRFLCEVIQKIKVDSKNEVHLFLKQPPQISLGLTVHSGVPNRI